MNIRKTFDTVFVGMVLVWATLTAIALLVCAFVTTAFVYLNGLTGLFLVLASGFALLGCVTFLFLVGSIAKRYLGL